MSWSKKFNQCQCCNTTIFPYKANGYCTTCHRVQGKIKDLNSASNLDPFIVKYLGVKRTQSIKSKPLCKQKEIIKEAIENKYLRHLKLYYQISNKKMKMDTLNLEMIFNDIGRHVTGKERFFTNDLMFFTTRFNEEQRTIVALKLLKMLIHTRH